jgi:hypothetical protein
MMDDETLRAIEERASKATPGEWTPWERGEPVENGGVRQRCYVTSGDPYGPAIVVSGDTHLWWNEQPMLDTRFIAHARTDIPLLLAEVRRLREALRLDVVKTLDALDDDVFIEVISGAGRCMECGRRDPNCQCWNDD